MLGTYAASEVLPPRRLCYHLSRVPSPSRRRAGVAETADARDLKFFIFFCLLLTAGFLLNPGCQKSGVADSEEAIWRLEMFQAIVVNDGGVMFTHDDFATFKHPVNLPIGHQFSLAATQTPGKFHLYSNIQDSGAWRGDVDMTAGRDNMTWTEWESTVGDEAGRHAIDPTNPDTVFYTTRYGGGPFLMDFLKPEPEPEEGQPRPRRRRGQIIAPDFGEETKRAQWVAPIIISPHSTKRILWGAQFVFLTDDGNFHTTMDEGMTWTLNVEGLPPERFISSIEASRLDEGTVYITISGKRHNDFNSYVFKSTDSGKTWMNIGRDVPGECANVIRQDPENGNILYLGTDRAVYISLDGGDSWDVLGTGLPTVYVHDIVIQRPENVLAIATHGRSSWVIDLLPVRSAGVDL